MLVRSIKKLQVFSRFTYSKRFITQFVDGYFERLNGAEIYPGPQASLKGREFLPGSQAKTFPEKLCGPREDFPLILKLKNTKYLKPNELATLCREKLDAYLPTYSAVLFRGLNLKTPLEFNEFYEHCGYENFNYVGGSGVREKLSSQIYNASNEPNNFNIELHNELSDTPICNQKIMLYCLLAPASGKGGISPICKNRDILKELDTKYIIKLKRNGIAYYRNNEDDTTTGAYSWQNTFETKCRKEAERAMESRGIEWTWLKNGRLRFWYKLNAFTSHPETGEQLWFNQITSHHCSYYQAHPFYKHLKCPGIDFPFHCSYGNGDEFEPELLQAIREAGWRNAVGFPWQHGDLIFLDNMVAQHGRLSFTGARTILLGLYSRLKLESFDDGISKKQYYTQAI